MWRYYNVDQKWHEDKDAKAEEMYEELASRTGKHKLTDEQLEIEEKRLIRVRRSAQNTSHAILHDLLDPRLLLS